MKYLLDEPQIDKIMKNYFDDRFDGAKWGEHIDDSGAGEWFGIINPDNVLLVGHPSHDAEIYFTNGQHFSEEWELFGLSPKDFNDAMGRYIKKRYGCDFKSIH